MMAPRALFDLTTFDPGIVKFDAAAIEAVNPHRGAMRLLDGVYWCDDDWTRAAAYKDVRPDEFWVPGHIPGRPLMPGVLMIEAAAQLASFVISHYLKKGEGGFIGFVGCDEVKFRNQVVPGDRLVILAEKVKFSSRRYICATQGWVGDNLCFEATITGMAI